MRGVAPLSTLFKLTFLLIALALVILASWQPWQSCACELDVCIELHHVPVQAQAPPRALETRPPACAHNRSAFYEDTVLPCGIPKIIHQSYKSKRMPNRFLAWSSTWRSNHPGWEWKLWLDRHNRKLVADDFPWLLYQYDALPSTIMRIDIARFLYLYKHGGVYADLDFESLRPLDLLLADKRGVVLAQMGHDLNFPHRIPNAWMASTPGHPFWMLCAYMATRAAQRGETQPEKVAGPVMLTNAAVAWKRQARREPLDVLQPGAMYPVDWSTRNESSHQDAACWPRSARFDVAACKAQFPDAYGITFWTHSWNNLVR